MISTDMSQRFARFPLADADRCVKCALCLPHCPTYRETLDEGESPRGRIALMQGFATSVLEITPRLSAHLDHCLACRACEAVCPAEVPYGELIDAARTELAFQGQAEPMRSQVFAFCMRHRPVLRTLHILLWGWQRLGLLTLASRSRGLRRLLRLLPPLSLPRAWPRVSPRAAPGGPNVALFLGCIARVTQPEVTQASIRLLRAIGCSVQIPKGQSCCGALDQHGGRPNLAAALAVRNLDAFDTVGNSPVLYTASACGATLNEYPRVVVDSRAAGFRTRTCDIASFLAAQSNFDRIPFKAWTATVLVHSPCTLKNVLKTDRSVMALLHRIPGLEVDMLPGDTGCCGAAGAYVMTQPTVADRLADHIIATVGKSRPTALVTSNVGCALHLRAALQRHGLEIPLLHPVEIMARQLPDSRPQCEL